jgi:hypothetical protein
LTRLIDDLLAYGWEQPTWAQLPGDGVRDEPFIRSTKRLLSAAVVFVIDEIAEYFYAGTDQETWSVYEDFPNLAPPYPVYWMEWRRPSKIVSDRYGVLNAQAVRERQPDEVGVLILASDLESTVFAARDTDNERRLEAHTLWSNYYQTLLEAHRRGSPRGDEALELADRFRRFTRAAVEAESLTLHDIEVMRNDHKLETKWIVAAYVFVRIDLRSKKTLLGPLLRYSYSVSEDGQMLPGASPSMLARSADLLSPEFVTNTSTIVFPAYFANSLLHCRNVSQIIHAPPEKLSRARQRRHREAKPLVTFRTLSIEPMKRTIQHEGSSQTVGLKRALHLVRGHFKQYRGDRKLFGRWEGTYFWNPHARGTLAAGAVAKDYNIKKPRREGR